MASVFEDAQRLNDNWEKTGLVDEKLLASVKQRIPDGYVMVEDYTLVPTKFFDKPAKPKAQAAPDTSEPSVASVAPEASPGGSQSLLELFSPLQGQVQVPEAQGILDSILGAIGQPVGNEDAARQLLAQISGRQQ